MGSRPPSNTMMGLTLYASKSWSLLIQKSIKLLRRARSVSKHLWKFTLRPLVPIVGTAVEDIHSTRAIDALMEPRVGIDGYRVAGQLLQVSPSGD